jgi:hypothetical protein
VSPYIVRPILCLHKFRQFGGSWYNPQSADELLFEGKCSKLDELEVFSITRSIGFAEDEGSSYSFRRFPKGMIVVQNALTMKERSIALEMLGAVFCGDIEGCLALYDLSKEPHELAEEMGVTRLADYVGCAL